MSSDRRLTATLAHQQAIATINEMFDRLDELTAARDRLTGVAPRHPEADPIQDAELLLDHARRLAGTLEALRAARIFTYVVTSDTYRTAQAVDEILVKTHASDTEKISTIIELVGGALDVDGLLARL